MATISEALAVALRHHQAGRLELAEQIYRRILAAEPNHADALHLLGVIAHQRGSHEVAVEYIRQAIGLKGSDAAFHNNLGEAYRATGAIAEAVACYRRALELTPDDPESHYNLGNALKAQGKLTNAVACYSRALEMRPDYAEAHNNLGNTLRDQGKLAEAVACCRRALERNPDFAEAYNNLGNALKDQGKLADAVACYRRAVERKPDFAEAHYNLGNALREQGRPADAVACYRRAIELRPSFVEAYNNLGNAFKDQGALDEAVACYHRAIERKPDFAQAHSNLVGCLHYRVGVTLSELAEAHARFDRQHAAPLEAAWRPHGNRRDPDRRLRLGIVSPDFGHHPVGRFLIRAMEQLDPKAAEAVCYCDRFIRDDLTDRFRATANTWHDVFGWSDQRLAEQIRTDRVDILFDLAGHTSDNRLLVFARKPAPIQITWIGYEGTTGLSAMDYLLADRYMVPEGSEPYYRERVLRMPEGYVCFDPPQAAPPVGPLPAVSQGQVTFGSFNNPAKITPEVVDVWARILRQLPQARLVLKYRGLSDEGVQHRYRELFAACGLEPGRLTLLPGTSYDDYLVSYQQIDIALDPFPFCGSVTTCEALWMGVPVITCPGETFASRHGLSHLTNIGLTETIARDVDDYVEQAVSLAGHLPRLTSLRAGLRQRMAASPLCDGHRFASDLMAILRRVWKQWATQGHSGPAET